METFSNFPLGLFMMVIFIKKLELMYTSKKNLFFLPYVGIEEKMETGH